MLEEVEYENLRGQGSQQLVHRWHISRIDSDSVMHRSDFTTLDGIGVCSTSFAFFGVYLHLKTQRLLG